MRNISITFMCVVSVSALAQAQDGTWVGKTVLLKAPGRVIKTTDDRGNASYYKLTGVEYEVLAEKGDRFVIVSDGRGHKGWLPREWVVPLEDSLEYFSDRIAKKPNDVLAYGYRAVAHKLIGNIDQAIKDYNEAIKLDPQSYNYVNRGHAWMSKKQYQNAMADYNEAIRLDPDFGYAYMARGFLWSAKKEFDKAISDFNEAAKYEPTFVRIFHCRACAYAAKGRTDSAIDDLQKAFELGFNKFSSLEKDERLDAVRKDPRYVKLIEKYKK